VPGNDAPAVGELKVTSPVGAEVAPASASRTAAVQVVAADTATSGGEHDRLAVVGSGAT